MKTILITAMTTAALTSGALSFAATAAAAPTGPSKVDEAVRTLEASGYNVIVNKTGAAPLAQCTVAGIRPGQTHSTTDSRGGSSLNTTVTSDTVYVDVRC
jgi:CMP-2-keto-3-deoxyoctulosonic acid synthetase